MRTLPRLLAILVALFIAVAQPALAREEIRNFNDAVTLRTDGSVDVTETIDVTAEGVEIRHGIFRDIPVVLINPDGSKLRSNLDVVSVTRDGQAEPYATESIENGVRIRIGSADSYVSTGPHRYVIRYKMTRMARRFADHDELYWNSTGNFWIFPILGATAVVTLPQGAMISGVKAYTGEFGAQQQDATAEKTADNVAVFRTTRALAPGEGMTVVVGFQKGILAEPGAVQGALYWLSDHRDIILPAIAVLIVLFYNFLAWDSVGRDPRRGTIIPRFYPPESMSPALVHYIRNLGWKKSGWTAFTASIFDLGVKGLVSIDNSDKKLKVTSRTTEAPDLPEEEAVLNAYFRSNGVTTVDKTSGPELDKKRQQVIGAVKGQAGDRYFKNNYLYSAGGYALSIAMLAGLVYFGVLDMLWLIVGVVAGIFFSVIGALFSGFARGRSFPGLAVAVWAVIILVNVGSGIGASLESAHVNFAAVAAVSIVLLTAFFGRIMRAATVEGRGVMDEIEGFRMYLQTAEKNRLNFVGEPQMSIERFERILPFAIALAVEKPWSTRFEADLARNAVAGATGGVYSPAWYSGGSDFSSRNISSNIASVASGMSAAMIAAQPAQSSSSGFSGGGGSGGGGGGGGGGGW